jgi:glycosyltransferase involved in cell wall biosynthesis
VRGSAPVAINARAGARAEIGGVERYASELADRLPILNPTRYRTLKPLPSLAHRLGHAWEQLALPLTARQARLIYSPANVAPLLTGRRNVIVIHDTAPFVTPQAYTAAYRAYHRALAVPLARRALHVITVSEFSKREIVEHLGVPADRVSVIAPGVDPDRFRPDGAAADKTRRELGLDHPYVLAVGTDSVRKNHAALIPAAAALAEHGIELVVAGGRRDYLSGTAATAGLRRLGYVPEELLPGLYAGARALAMPSIHEGFGLPCIEAMASGTPVVAAAAGALPETCQDAAILVRPNDADGFTQALLALAAAEADQDTPPATDLRTKGRRRAADFTWDRTAAETDAVITARLG